MSTRKVKFKGNGIRNCPKCNNHKEFIIISEQVCEDGCEIWAECKCGYNPTSHENMGSSYRVEDIWGSLSDTNCTMAIECSWNDPIKELGSVQK